MSTTRREFLQGSALVVGSLVAGPGSLDALAATPEAQSTPASGPVRVVAYVDGLSLYHGLRDRGWRRYYWLNAQALAQNLLKPGQQLAATKYFTARATGPAGPRQGQVALLEALSSLRNLHVYYGKYHANPAGLRAGTSRPAAPHEKSSDVNLAVELLSDAVENAFDTALIISADSDLYPALKACRRLFPDKRIVVAFPPRRVSEALKQVSHAYLHIGRDKLARSLLPPELPRLDGYVLKRPVSWR
jgi:NYN domain